MGSSTPWAAGATEDSLLGISLQYHHQQKSRCLRKLTSSNLSPTLPSSSSRRPSVSDTDKDGLLSSSDLVAAFAAHGKSIGGGDAQAMLDEVDGPMNFTQMVTLFATKMAGGSDDDDVILASFEAFEQDGKIDADTFRAQ